MSTEPSDLFALLSHFSPEGARAQAAELRLRLAFLAATPLAPEVRERLAPAIAETLAVEEESARDLATLPAAELEARFAWLLAGGAPDVLASVRGAARSRVLADEAFFKLVSPGDPERLRFLLFRVESAEGLAAQVAVEEMRLAFLANAQADDAESGDDSLDAFRASIREKIELLRARLAFALPPEAIVARSEAVVRGEHPGYLAAVRAFAAAEQHEHETFAELVAGTRYEAPALARFSA